MSTILLTGATGGIGQAAVARFAADGHELWLLGRSEGRLQELCAQALAAGASACHAVPVELRDSEALRSVVGGLLTLRGPPDVLVNNAGVVRRATVLGTSEADWDEQLTVNLKAPFLLSQLVLPGMLARRSGRIVNVGSISATLACPGAAAYAASKWGLVGFTRSLAEELSDSGVTCCALLPGSVDTAMLRGSGFSPRMTPAEVATTLAFYALEAGPAHNGAVIEMFGV